eukprot:1142786-Pelagomonas_calceolata.AAC.3
MQSASSDLPFAATITQAITASHLHPQSHAIRTCYTQTQGKEGHAQQTQSLVPDADSEDCCETCLYLAPVEWDGVVVIDLDWMAGMAGMVVALPLEKDPPLTNALQRNPPLMNLPF